VENLGNLLGQEEMSYVSQAPKVSWQDDLGRQESVICVDE
jgi:hypothetical protein